MMQKTLKLMILSSCLVFAGCASMGGNSQSNVNTANLETLQSLEKQSGTIGTSVGQIRADALKDTALSLGAQGGLAYRSKQLNEMTLENQSSLDQVFNFQRLMLDHGVLPPVLEEADKSLSLDGPTAIRLSGRIYRIEQQAQFVTTPPNWRQYLLLNFDKPGVPSDTLLPKNSQERDLWKKYIAQGWQEGINQADNIYTDNLARLKRDYKGMMLYRTLLTQNIVSQPYVAQANLGVTSNKDHSELYINDRVLRITALPQLNANSKEWKPVAETNDGTNSEQQ
jgi:defect-in-organelle-trafficking protein DotC